MTSDGSSPVLLSGWKRVTQTSMDALNQDLDTALGNVPADIRDAVRNLFAAEEQELYFRRPGATLQRGGPRPWFEDWDPSEGYLWRRLRSYLIDQKGWSLRDIEALDASSDNVLRHLEDPVLGPPTSKDKFRVQGLVLGYVQSGKTANFTSLIAKSADRGYRLVIVLSGIHNSLRHQTQRRLDLELGLVGDPKGVGLPESGQAWWSITQAGLDGDFKPGTDAGPLEQGSRGIMVIKKNATVLRRLVNWLDGRVPDDLPALIIDDEADQASINLSPQLDEVDLGNDTGEYPLEKELDPSTINGLIRELIGSFNRVSYVAYTATPFANVLIDPDVESADFGSDLFPRDFIVSLPRPPAYVGADRIFGRSGLDAEDPEVRGLDVVRVVPEGELSALVPKGRGAANWEPSITPSLREAIFDWILATAGKIQRMGDGISTMLIHTTSRTAQQNALEDVVADELRAIRNQWRYEKSELRPELQKRWEADFRPVTVTLNADLDVAFEAIEEHVNTLLSNADGINLLVLNSTSSHVLDYETDPKLKVVLIGGNRLSRGLTLEDLTVSFYVREANTYDTLLQMGRWFGFRSKFVDLTRLWTTEELVSRFRHLALVEESLRDQIKMYEMEQLTPLDVAPKIRSHPAMLVTAKNRMGSAEKVKQSYAGELLQSVRFRLGVNEWLAHNVDKTAELLASLGAPTGAPRSTINRPVWGGVPWEYVSGFLHQFRTAQDATVFDAATAARYIQRQAEGFGELVEWTVGLRCGGSIDPELGAWDAGLSDLGPVPHISRSRLSTDSGSIGVLASPVRRDNPGSGDEAIDLDDGQIQRATERVDDFPTVGHALRWQRDRTQGLLLLYPISPRSKPGAAAQVKNRVNLFDDPSGKPTVMGVALSFPPSGTGATVEYIAGKQSQHSSSWRDE